MLHYKNEYTGSHIDVNQLVNNNELILGCLDLCITTRCNQKCKGCSSLMPLYKSPSDVDLEIIINSLEKLFSIINRIIRVHVLGGEPFLHSKLAQIIEYLNKKKEIDEVILLTNGTDLPDDSQLYAALRGPKNRIRISCYDSTIERIGRTTEKFEQNNISYYIKRYGKSAESWFDCGGFEVRNRTDSELEKQYNNCKVEWMSLLKGNLYPCPRAAHSIDLGLQPSKGNCIPLMNDSISHEELRKQIIEFSFNSKFYPACNRCDRGTEQCKVIQAAQQH